MSTAQPRVLVVEDEEHLADGIRFNLEEEAYAVEVVGDGPAALARLVDRTRSGFDLVILDVMLPGLDGFEVAERVREAGNHVPILMLTAKSQPEDTVRGLDVGADDYLPKPFELSVLLARIRGLLRRRDWSRQQNGDLEKVSIGAAEVDFPAFELRSPGKVVGLTSLEAGLLRLLVRRAGQVVSKAEILEQVWQVAPDTETRAVDNFIGRLRRYLEPDPSAPKHLVTVRGAGYKLVTKPAVHKRP